MPDRGGGVIKEDLSEKQALKQRTEGGKGGSTLQAKEVVRAKALRQECWNVAEENLEAIWIGAKWVRGKRVGNEVREVRRCKDFGFILSKRWEL